MTGQELVDAILKAMEERNLDMVAWAWSDPCILSDDDVREMLSQVLLPADCEKEKR